MMSCSHTRATDLNSVAHASLLTKHTWQLEIGIQPTLRMSGFNLNIGHPDSHTYGTQVQTWLNAGQPSVAQHHMHM
jgi:hypothetical protein